MQYYGLILLSVAMFGGCFVLNDTHRRLRGASLKVSLQASLTSSLVGLIVLFIINGFRFEFTPFSLLIALGAAVNGIVLSFCGYRALGTINLSLYSLFMMLGGMVLPFLQGIVFYGEPLSFAKGICFLLICVALAITVRRGEHKKEGTVFYAAIFILNGMSGVLSKIFVASPYEKTSASGYAILIACCTAALSSALLFFFFRRRDDGASKMTLLSVGISGISGGTNKVANMFLTVALLHVDASVQYPMVTGGVMIVSTIAAFLRGDKPSGREILSVAVAFVGLLALFLVPV